MQTATATAYHQQVQALAPTATAETSGTGRYLLATLTTPAGQRVEAAGFTAGDVVAELRDKLAALAATARPDFMTHYGSARLVADRTA